MFISEDERFPALPGWWFDAEGRVSIEEGVGFEPGEEVVGGGLGGVDGDAAKGADFFGFIGFKGADDGFGGSAAEGVEGDAGVAAAAHGAKHDAGFAGVDLLEDAGV